MNRHILKIFFSATIALSTVLRGAAYDILVDGIAYHFIEGGTQVEIVEGSTATYVDIPDSLLYEGTIYPVTAIAANAFRDSKIKTIIIPNSVTNVGNFAFYNCDSLNVVEFPESITTIPFGVLERCNSLFSVSIPGAVEVQGAAFAFSAIKHLKIPTSLERWTSDALYSRDIQLKDNKLFVS